MATVQVLIGGVDKTSLIDWTSFRKTEVLTKDPDTLEFSIRNYPTKTYQPPLNAEVIVNYGGSRIFGGFVISSDEIVDGLLKYFTVVAKDYSQILDRLIVANVYEGMTAEDIVDDLITNYASGLTVGTLNAPITIPFLKLNYISVRECLKKIINLVGNYDYSVSYNGVVSFLPVGVTAAPFALTDTSGNYNWNTLQVKADLSQLTNVIIIRGATRTGTTLMTEYFDGDANKYIFALAYNYADVPTITVGGSGKTVGRDGVDIEASFQCMWNPTSQTLRFTTGNTPGAGTRNIVVTGYPRYPLLVQKLDSNSVTTYGQWQKVIIDKNLQDQDTASQRADAELLYNSQPIYNVSFVTEVDGLIKGQQLSLSSVLRSISLSLKIQQISTTLKTPTGTLAYEITAVSSPPVGINEVLNQLLIKDPANTIDINTTELIEIYFSFDESVAITDAISAPTHTTGPYVWGTMVWGFFTWG